MKKPNGKWYIYPYNVFSLFFVWSLFMGFFHSHKVVTIASFSRQCISCSSDCRLAGTAKPGMMASKKKYIILVCWAFSFFRSCGFPHRDLNSLFIVWAIPVQLLFHTFVTISFDSCACVRHLQFAITVESGSGTLRYTSNNRIHYCGAWTMSSGKLCAHRIAVFVCVRATRSCGYVRTQVLVFIFIIISLR